MTGRWRPVLGWEGLYDVSDEGQIRSLRRGLILRSRPSNCGHLRVCLQAAPRRADVWVHRAVLEAFVGPAPAGMVTCHNDGDPTNNHLSNLRWDTMKANCQDTLRHGANFFANKTHCKRDHEFTPENTWINPRTGHRQCRKCFAMRTAEFRRRQRELLPSTPAWVAPEAS